MGRSQAAPDRRFAAFGGLERSRKHLTVLLRKKLKKPSRREGTMREGLIRREFLVRGGAVAGIAMLQGHSFAQTGSAEKLVPWVDQPAPVPATAAAIKALTPWEQLDAWITPNDKFFSIAHYNVPAIDEKNWRLDVTGLVAKPFTL